MKPVFTHALQIPFADTDLAGIVHFSNFFRYMENAEHAFYRSLGFSVHPAASAAKGLESYPGYGLPKVSASCDYKKPLRFEHELRVEIYLEERRSKTIHYQFRFLTDDSDEPIAVGRMTTICVRFDDDTRRMRAVTIPDAIAEKIDSAAD